MILNSEFSLLKFLVGVGVVLAAPAAMALETDGQSAMADAHVVLARSLAALRQRLAVLADPEDPVDSLYFGWFDRPYGRATVACALKGVAVLERELRLRRAGHPGMTEEQVRAILAWIEDAVERAGRQDTRDGFYPHRIRIADSSVSEAFSVPLFGFVDRVTATRLDEGYGDLDLLACCGLGVYARAARPALPAATWRSLLAHAAALGERVVIVEDGGGGAGFDGPSSGVEAVRMRPVTLRQLFELDPAAGGVEPAVLAVLDPAAGESWAESSARRGLYRGVLNQATAAVCGWTLPAAKHPGAVSPAEVRAAMWACVCDGQSVALLEGWRDQRDGSLSPYPSRIADPACMEAVAHTGLDVLYHRRMLAAFAQRSPLVVLVDSSAVEAGDPNRWAFWFAALAAELHQRQIRFDVLPRKWAGDSQRLTSYPVAVDVAGPDGRSAAAYRAGVPAGTPVAGENLGTWAARLLGAAAPTTTVGVTDTAGQTVTDVFARSAVGQDGQQYLALVNLSGRSQRVGVHLANVRLPSSVVDAITASPVADLSKGVDFAPWQVRLLTLPGQPSK